MVERPVSPKVISIRVALLQSLDKNLRTVYRLLGVRDPRDVPLLRCCDDGKMFEHVGGGDRPGCTQPRRTETETRARDTGVGEVPSLETVGAEFRSLDRSPGHEHSPGDQETGDGESYEKTTQSSARFLVGR
jgi:hypothetical protein